MPGWGSDSRGKGGGMRYFPLFKRVKSWRALCGAAFLILGFSPSALAQQAALPAGTAETGTDVTSMDIEALMNLDVTTASRFADKVSDAPSIMCVVTRVW